MSAHLLPSCMSQLCRQHLVLEKCVHDVELACLLRCTCVVIGTDTQCPTMWNTSALVAVVSVVADLPDHLEEKSSSLHLPLSATAWVDQEDQDHHSLAKPSLTTQGCHLCWLVAVDLQLLWRLIDNTSETREFLDFPHSSAVFQQVR